MACHLQVLYQYNIYLPIRSTKREKEKINIHSYFLHILETLFKVADYLAVLAKITFA